MHHLLHPTDGNCECDEASGWQAGTDFVGVPSRGTDAWQCDCWHNFLTTEGQCINCDEFFPGCTSCSPVAEGGSQIDARLGLQVQLNPVQSDITAGTYMCDSCADAA